MFCPSHISFYLSYIASHCGQKSVFSNINIWNSFSNIYNSFSDIWKYYSYAVYSRLISFSLYNIYILYTISLAPPTLINNKLCEINYYFLYLLQMLKACILATKTCKMFLASRIVLRVSQQNSKGGRQVKITLLIRTLLIFLCHVVFNIARP